MLPILLIQIVAETSGIGHVKVTLISSYEKLTLLLFKLMIFWSVTQVGMHKGYLQKQNVVSIWQREFVYSAWGEQATCVIISLVSLHKTSIAFNSTQNIFYISCHG